MTINLEACERFMNKLGFEADSFTPTEKSLTQAESLIEAGFNNYEALKIMSLSEASYKSILNSKINYPDLGFDNIINNVDSLKEDKSGTITDFILQVREEEYRAFYCYEEYENFLPDYEVTAPVEKSGIKQLISNIKEYIINQYYLLLPDSYFRNKYNQEHNIHLQEMGTYTLDHGNSQVISNEREDFIKILRDNHLLGLEDTQAGIDRLYEDYNKNPEIYNPQSKQFNPDRMNGITKCIPAEKFDGYDRDQSWVIKTAFLEFRVDPTPYITPNDSYQKIFTVSQILKESQYDVKSFSKQQLDKLTEILYNERDGSKVGIQLINPKYSVSEMNHVWKVVNVKSGKEINIGQEIENYRSMEKVKSNHSNSDKGKFILSDEILGIKLSVNNNKEVLNYFRQYATQETIEKWNASGLVETKDQFHYLEDENPVRLASVLNHQLGTDIKVHAAEKEQLST